MGVFFFKMVLQSMGSMGSIHPLFVIRCGRLLFRRKKDEEDRAGLPFYYEDDENRCD